MWEQHPSRVIQDPVALLASAYHLHAFTEACELEAGLWLILKSKVSLLTTSCCGWATAELLSQGYQSISLSVVYMHMG